MEIGIRFLLDIWQGAISKGSRLGQQASNREMFPVVLDVHGYIRY